MNKKDKQYYLKLLDELDMFIRKYGYNQIEFDKISDKNDKFLYSILYHVLNLKGLDADTGEEKFNIFKSSIVLAHIDKETNFRTLEKTFIELY